MRTLDYNKIENCKINKFNFDIGRYFNQSIDLFTNNWQNFVLYSIIAGFLFSLSYITIIGPLILIYPMLNGFLIGAEKADNKETLQLNDFFGGLKNIGTYFLFNLSIFAIYFILLTPFFLFLLVPLLLEETHIDNIGLLVGSSIIMLIFMSIIILSLFIFMVLIYLTPYLIFYGNMGVLEAMKTSYAITKKNFWWILLMMMVVNFISSVGAFGCYIGIFVTLPLSYIFKYFMLKDMILTDDNEKSEIDTLGIV